MEVGRPAWTYRTHEDYDPNRIGAVSEAKVIAALVEAGKAIWLAHIRCTRCDLLFEDEGSVWRVQCKTGHVVRWAVYFTNQSLRAAPRGTEWRRVAANYEGQTTSSGSTVPTTGGVSGPDCGYEDKLEVRPENRPAQE